MGRSEKRHPKRWNRVAGFEPHPKLHRNAFKGLCIKAVKEGLGVYNVVYRCNRHGQPKRRNDRSLMFPIARNLQTV